MDDFARKQKQFLEQAMEGEEQATGSATNMDYDSSRLRNNEYYDCVICNVCSPSTEAKPMGLVVLVQATSVLGHRRRQTQPERDNLPVSDHVIIFFFLFKISACIAISNFIIFITNKYFFSNILGSRSPPKS